MLSTNTNPAARMLDALRAISLVGIALYAITFAVGISAQDLDSHRGFIEKNGLTLPLLADVDKRVAKSYGAYSSRLGTKRAVIVIDEQGVVGHRHDHLLGLDYQSVDDLKAALDALPRPAAT